MKPRPYCPRTTRVELCRAQRLRLLVPDRVGVEVDRRLHRRQGDELERVVLEDVARRAGLLVERGAPLDPDRLGDRDLDVVDVLPRPERLEDPVREPEREQVLHRLLAEVVVDPEHLALAEVPQQERVQLPRRREVAAERLLDDHARPAARRPPLAELLDERRERLRRDGQVVEAVAFRPPLAVDLAELLRDQVVLLVVAELRRDVVRRLRELLPDVVAELVASVLAHRGRHLLAERVVAELRAGAAEHGELLRQQVPSASA